MNPGAGMSDNSGISDIVDDLTVSSARERLYERLSRIQRSISHRAPLQEVLDAVTHGLSELLGDECAAVRLIDERDPSFAINVSYAGLAPEVAASIHRTPVGQGAGGRAILENRLVVVHDYDSRPDAIPALGRSQLKAAMAAPLLQAGAVAGALIVASFKSGRVFDRAEQDALVAFAEHASLALTDARAMQELRDAQQDKEMFLAMVSHELKTPLTVILGTLQTLNRDPSRIPEAVSQELIEAAVRRAKELERLINRLLQGSRAELARATQTIALPDLIARVVTGFDQQRPIVVEEAPEATLSLDVDAVSEIAGIVLENAADHSDPDIPIRVAARVERKELSLRVRNAGSLPESLESHELFQPFRRGDGVTSPGIGLGLYIAARLAASLGGRIDVDGSGGLVTFTLRCPVGAEVRSDPEVEAASGG